MKAANTTRRRGRPDTLSRLALALAMAGLAACGGSGSVQNQLPAGDDVQLKAERADTLIKGSMLNYYSNTNRDGGFGGGGFVDGGFPVAVADTAELASSSADSNSGGGATSQFSDTNVQEAGVDEADRVKIDGNVLFSLERAQQAFPLPVDGALEIAIDSLSIVPYQGEVLSAYRLDGDNSSLVARRQLDLGNQSAEGMYLHNAADRRELVVLSRGSFNVWGSWFETSQWSGLQTRVSWFDAADPAAIESTRTLEVDGQLISSRKIDNRLIMVTRFHPQLEGLNLYPFNEDQVEANRQLIEQADPESLLPGYVVTTNGVASDRQLIVQDNQCFSALPVTDPQVESDTDDSGVSDQAILPEFPTPNVISIISVDLDSQDISIDSGCFVGDSETLYVSTESLYLATTQYSYSFSSDSLGRPTIADYSPQITTDIHKFSLQNSAPAFRGSASVDGHLGWYAERKPYRMSEKDGNLRVVTFNQDNAGSPVTLNVLAEAGNGTLRTVASLPNDSRPEHIGKPGENLYASRFIGDRAYLVTFRVTDPLYVLDLADPADPRIAGELELPGYSDYLHPVNEGLLVGLGKDAVADDGTSGWGDGRGAWYQGVKLALFDVSDPGNPQVVDSRVIGKRGTDSPALTQPHAFAWLAGDQARNARLAIPLSLHDGGLSDEGDGSDAGQPWAWAAWTSNNMLTMEVNEVSKTFEEVPDWVFESNSGGFGYSPVSLYDDRAIIGTAGDVYYLHNGALHFGQWGSDAPTSVAR